MMQVSGSGPPNAAHIEFDLSGPVAFGLMGGTRRLELGAFRHSLTTRSSPRSLTTKPAQPTCVLPQGGTLSSSSGESHL